jgi:hypothetical protein
MSTTALADYMKTKFGKKALPWQADDDEPEISVTGGDVRSLGTPVPRAEHSSGTPAPRAERSPARPTLPLRPPADDLAVPTGVRVAAAPVDGDDDLSVPVVAIPYPRAATLPFHSTSVRPPAEIVVGAPAPAQSRRNRRLWLAGSIAAVVIAGVSLIIASSGGSEPATPRASKAPVEQRTAVPLPFERPTVTHEPVAAPAIEEQPAPVAPAKKPRRAKKVEPKPEVKPAAPKKWDPDALFPH